MKKIILGVTLALLASGCASTTSTDSTQTTQVAYVQACAAYSGVFATALQLRKAGKLDAVQVSQVSLIDSQITPICTGALPADTAAAVQQITAAVTALTIIEAIQKAN